jgi:hypothetical protein
MVTLYILKKAAQILAHKENGHDVKEKPKVITFLGIERKAACSSS